MCIYGNKVTILEASSHVGGRVQTYRNQNEGWYADLGAMRIPSSHRYVAHIHLAKQVEKRVQMFFVFLLNSGKHVV